MATERDPRVPPVQRLRHLGAALPLAAETAAGEQMLVIMAHMLGVLQCVVHSTSATPYRRLVSLIVLVIVLVLAARVPMPVLPELHPPLPLM